MLLTKKKVGTEKRSMVKKVAKRSAEVMIPLLASKLRSAKDLRKAREGLESNRCDLHAAGDEGQG